MLIIQSGVNVYTPDPASGQKFKKLPLTYNDYPTAPTPESLNESIDWLLAFLKRHSLPYTILINEEASRGPTPATIIVYANFVSGSTVKGDPIALYTIANAITTGATQSLEKTLLEELT
jgi:hypothetical protein